MNGKYLNKSFNIGDSFSRINIVFIKNLKISYTNRMSIS